MKPNEILEPVIKLSSITTDILFWLSDEKETRFKEIAQRLSSESLSYLMIQIPDSITQLSAVEITDLTFQIKEYMRGLTSKLNNLDSNKTAYVLKDTDFEFTSEFTTEFELEFDRVLYSFDISSKFHRIVYLTVFNALNLLRSFERALAQTLHESGYMGLKPKEAVKGMIEKIYDELEHTGLINHGCLQDFKAIFTDSYLPGNWHMVVFHDKRGIRQFPFDLIELVTGQNVGPETVNKYFRISGGRKDGRFDSNDVNKNQEKKVIKGTLYRSLIKNIRPV